MRSRASPIVANRGLDITARVVNVAESIQRARLLARGSRVGAADAVEHRESQLKAAIRFGPFAGRVLDLRLGLAEIPELQIERHVPRGPLEQLHDDVEAFRKLVAGPRNLVRLDQLDRPDLQAARLSLEQRDRALLPVGHLAVQRRGLWRLRQRLVERREQYVRITIKILVSDRHRILAQERGECCGHRCGRRHFRAAHQAGNEERAAIEDGGDLAAHEVVGTCQSVQGAEPASAHNDHTRRALRQRGVQLGDEILSQRPILSKSRNTRAEPNFWASALESSKA